MKKKHLLSTNLLWFMGTMILANIAAQMIMPLEALYVQELGASVAQVGMFFTIASIAPLFLQIFGGWLSDSIGRLQAVAIGSVAGASAYLFYLFAPSWIWLLPSSILTAMAVAFVAPSFQAFIAEESTEETRGRVYGITSTLFMVVNIIGPTLGSLIVQGMNFKTMYLVAGGFYVVAAVIRVWMARRVKRAQQSVDAAAPKMTFADFKKSMALVFGLLVGGGIITWIFISDGIRDISFSLTGRLTPLYMENIIGLKVFQIGLLQSVTAVVAMMFVGLAGWLADKKGERTSLVGGFGLIALGWFVFVNGSQFVHFALAHAIIGVGWALIDPAYNSLISKVVPQKIRGTAFGLFSTSLGLISLPAPWMGAWLWENVNPRFPFYVPLIGMLATLPIMWIKFKLPSQPESAPAATSPVLAEVPVAADGAN